MTAAVTAIVVDCTHPGCCWRALVTSRRDRSQLLAWHLAATHPEGAK